MRWLRRLPLVVGLILIWSVLRANGSDVSSGSAFGIIIILIGLPILIMEFFKSGDIGLRSFMLDLAYGGLAIVFFTFAMTKLWESGKPLALPDWVVGMIAFADFFIGPTNAFRTALRNWSAGGGTGLAAAE